MGTGAVVLMAWFLITADCPADKSTGTVNRLRFDSSLLDDTVFESRSHHRLFAAAQKAVAEGNYNAGFGVLLELFRKPHDSSRFITDDGPVVGTRSAAVQLLSSLPFSVRRRWDQFCKGHGSAQLTKALQSESRLALAQIATAYPCSSVAADALITDVLLALKTQDITEAQMAIRQLQELLPLSILTRSRTTLIRRLSAAIEAEQKSFAAIPKDAAGSIRRSLDPKPIWYWSDNAWTHPQGPDLLPKRNIGSQFHHRTGWQQPVLNDETVILRSPAGIVCLDRFSGEQQWFLPLSSVAAPRRTNDVATDPIFELASDPLRRLETAGDLIYFVDGQRSAPVDSPRGIPSRLVLEPGATNLVAVRNGRFPVVLWQVTGEDKNIATSMHGSSHSRRNFRYRLKTAPDRPHTAAPYPEHDLSVSADPRFAGHLFLSAPKIFAGRLYVTTLYDGITWLNCLSAAHGTLTWQQPLTWLGGDFDNRKESSAVVGGITNDTVICLFGNGLIAACSPIDGHIEWIQSVRFEDESAQDIQHFGAGLRADSRHVPQTAAGTEFGELWMMLSPAGIICARRGSHGITCLDTHTGEIRWAISRGVRNGPAAGQQDLACIGLIGSRLITAGYGHCRAINVTDGSETWARPLGNHGARICTDELAVYVALNSGRLLTIDGNTGCVIGVQELNLSQTGPGFVIDLTGIVETSAWSARAWQWRTQSDNSPHLTAQKALDCLTAHRLNQLHLTTPDSGWAAAHSLKNCYDVVNSSILSPVQLLKQALIRPGTPGQRTILREHLNTTPDRLIDLIPGWTVPLHTAVRTLETDTQDTVQPNSPGESVLRPNHLGATDSQFAAAKNLIHDNQLSRAELLLLNMDTGTNSADAVQRDELLRTVRNSAMAPGMRRTTPVASVKSEVHVESSHTDGFRLNDIAMSYQKFRLRSPAASVPTWSQSLFITFIPSPLRNNLGIAPHIGLIDLGRGIETAWEPLSNIRFPAGVSYTGDWNSPGLVVVARQQRLGVISLLNDAPLTPLWTRPYDSDAAGLAIAITARQLVVSTNSGVQSLHPLTGKLLWSRDWTKSCDLHHLEGQFLKVYCSDEHLILLSSLGTGYVVLRAADGAVVRQGSRGTGKLSRVIDEYLLTKTASDTLEIINLVTGNSIPVDPSVQPISDFHSGGMLGQSKAMVMTADSHFIILDPASGNMDTRIDISHDFSAAEHPLLSPLVFHRSGLTYVALSVRNWRSPYVPVSVFGEAVTGRGVLICIDPTTGEELWRQNRNSVVIPPVFGDPCPFLVLWSPNYTSGRRQFTFPDGRRHTSLEIKVLDSFTGQLVARHQQPYAARPLQVLHDATGQEITITTDQSTVGVSYSQ